MRDKKTQHREYMRKWCADNREHVRENANKNYAKRKTTTEQYLFLRELKTAGCCACGELDPRCLQFHHRDPAQKLFSVGGGTPSMKRLIAEVDKCIPLCANCHCKLHYAFD